MEACSKLKKALFVTALLSLTSTFSTSTVAKSRWLFYSYKPRVDIGVMAGYTGGNRRGNIVNPATSGSANDSGSQDSSELGLQARLLLGSECHTRPFLYLNGTKTIGSPVRILLGKILPPFTNGSKITLANNWLSRLGLGITTPWLYDTFQLGFGAGIVALNQTIETYLGETTVHTFSQNKTTLRPTVMGSVTWSVCEKCLWQHEALISAQITVDNNPNLNQSVPSSIGTLSSTVNQQWVPRGDIIFSIGLG